MEVEVKFRVNFEEMSRKITGIGAVFVGEEMQEDLYFSLRHPELLRLRRTANTGKAFMTYKYIKDPGKNEEFDELEISISDFETAREMLKRLGFREDVWVRKHRLVYRLGDITFELNRVEDIGDFLDIEVISDDVESAKRKIWEIARKLGLSESDVESRLYQELIKAKDH